MKDKTFICFSALLITKFYFLYTPAAYKIDCTWFKN